MLISEVKYNLSDHVKNNVCDGMRARSNTFPTSNADISRVRNSLRDFRRTLGSHRPPNASISTASPGENVDIKLIPTPTNDTSTLNAKDYVYLGCLESLFMMDMGATLDKDGSLVFIKGQRQGLLLGTYKKCFHKKKYQCYSVEKTNNDLLFDGLYINEQGKLIGKMKSTSQQCEIDIDENSKIFSTEEPEKIVRLHITKKDSPVEEDMKFKRKDGKVLTFSIKNNALYLSEVKIENDASHHNHGKPFKAELPDGYSVISAKKTKNMIQLETHHENKKRILYLNPNEITLYKIRKKHFSHKPPQSLYSALGADPYEHYDSGQPFSSTRRGNFSSKRIILLGRYIDNVRINIRESKEYWNNDQHRESLAAMAKAFDPGVQAIAVTTKNFFSKKSSEDISSEATDMKKNYASIIKKLPDTAISNNDFAITMTDILNNLQKGEQLSLSTSSGISFFAGIARGAAPIYTGAFAGIVSAISKKSCITFNKTDDGEILCSFHRNFSWLLALLLGTGQGLDLSLPEIADITYLNILFTELNLIYLHQNDKSKMMTFYLKKEHLNDFMIKSSQNTELMHFLKEKEINIFKKDKKQYSNKLSLEARAPEVRAQMGTGYGQGNFIVAPRSTMGIMTSFDLLSRTKTKETNILPDGDSETRKTVHSNNFSINNRLVFENKIMPIASTDIGGHAYFFPVPIIEEAKSKNIFSKLAPNKKVKEYINSDRINIPAKKTILDITESLKKIDMTVERVHGIKCLTNLAVTIKKSNKKYSINKKKHSFNSWSMHTDFIGHLKKLKHGLSNRERDSNGKSMHYNIRTEYILSDESKSEKNHLENKIEKLNNKKPQASLEEINDLYSQVSRFKKNATYLLSKIDLMSIGDLSESLSTISNLAISIHNKKTIGITKNLGTITFEYSENDKKKPHKIISDLKLLE